MATAARLVEAPIERLEVAAYTIPTDTPESDGSSLRDRAGPSARRATGLPLIAIEEGG